MTLKDITKIKIDGTTKAKYNAGFRTIQKFVQRIWFSGTLTVPPTANPHYT